MQKKEVTDEHHILSLSEVWHVPESKGMVRQRGYCLRCNPYCRKPPSKDELQEMYQKSGLELKKFFNTSGKKYRELGLKDKVKTASEDELLAVLASDGMLIKRPLTTDGESVTVGFNEETFTQTWKK